MTTGTRPTDARRKPNRTKRNRQSCWEFIPSGSTLESRLRALLRSSADRTVGEILAAQTSKSRRGNTRRMASTASASPVWPKRQLRRTCRRHDAPIFTKNEDTLSSGNLQGDQFNLTETSPERASIAETLTPTLTPTSTLTIVKSSDCATEDFHGRCAAVVAECTPGSSEARSASQMSEGLELLLAASQSASLDMTP